MKVGREIQSAIIQKAMTAVFAEKKQRESICELWHRTTFRNTTIYRIYKQEQPMQMTQAGPPDQSRAEHLRRMRPQNKLRLLLKCHGALLCLATDHYT